ncbi:MAG: ribonuclease P protein component [Candidatus Sungbacteria bacterium RIFCSPLOWO2_12_FULL_41_11]|uniref:Ribonuclease P protein component n=1 Tax=Candidatus Sungbacteria bacterium RIFCSPLOWO2_12_FULL_41_11 TaxID=1802286 RepID=A0A1G2LRE2_9BACT|nr:MAG: ribonuclease P protein component [Candidatus Sungbacteria bacterium RIFCSPHIGHO2_02_FULL_41_12b]OHA14210.1 MAG: ribonuclease P protein component [Candidatus Sungbacteria bacterium RIFCSPLOWO2_12_FULL_41_11]
MALPRQFRLKRKDVRNVFMGSRRFSSVIGTFFLKKNGFLFNRFGFAVPVSVSKKSNARNRIKRMAVEWTCAHFREVAGGFDVLVIFKKEVVNLNKKEFYKHLRASFINAGIFKGSAR